MSDGNPIFVTRPALPPLEEFTPLLEEIWQSRSLSNDGQFHKRFEKELCRYLGVNDISLVANATLGLILALRRTASQGEVITTPFSFVATGHAIVLAGLEPVFVDIDPDTLNIDPACVEAAVSSRTKALLPVHCFGQRCDVAAIEEIARKHELEVIYDSAHAFAVQDDGGSILRHGDMSVLSFHATKVFNTFEGGAVVCRNPAAKVAIDRLRNFGIEDESTITAVGLNAKMNEFSAALGLLQLTHIDDVIARREIIHARYHESLSGLSGIRCPAKPADQTQNYYSFPILVEPSGRYTRDRLFALLKAEGIHARRYFYPLISDLKMYQKYPSASPENLAVAHQIADQILCLPLYPDLSENDQTRIVESVQRFARHAI